MQQIADETVRHEQALLDHFAQITRIPRRSTQEGRIREHIRQQAETLGLAWKTDDAGNLLVVKPASKGFENRPTVALQAHMDMVYVADRAGVDFDTTPITMVEEDGWLRADGTSLGADDGAGVAIMLTLMHCDDLRHGKLELLFTADEELGMSGAANLPDDVLTARTLINLDGEDFDLATIGSAGGLKSSSEFPFVRLPVPADHVFYQVTLAGGLGGHSGLIIDRGRANMIKLLAAFLHQMLRRHGLALASIEGGQAINSVPDTAQALVGVPSAVAQAFAGAFSAYAATMQKNFAENDPDLTFTLTPAAAPSSVADAVAVASLLGFLDGAPDGVRQMSAKIPGLVETSSNIGVLKTGDTAFTVKVFQRSSVEAHIDTLRDDLEALYAAQDKRVSVQHTGRYPGWDAQPDSVLLRTLAAAFHETCGVRMKSQAMHVGLECGYFAKKFPGMDIVSIGPQLHGVHSTGERMNLSTFYDIWRVVLKTLETLESPARAV